MPLHINTARLIRRQIITHADVCRANDATTTELENLGFWSRRLEKIDVYWTLTSLDCYGWYQGDIYIPAVTGARLSDYFQGRHVRLTDVLRHEWGHAVADKWPALIDTRRFVRDFGGPYESPHPVWRYDPDEHLTRYAATMPCEDFAETFYSFLRHKGRLPVRLRAKPKIVRKWQFLEWMAGKISR